MAQVVRLAGPEKESATRRAVAIIKDVEAISRDLPGYQGEPIARFLIDAGELDLAGPGHREVGEASPRPTRSGSGSRHPSNSNRAVGRAIAHSKAILERDPSDPEARRIMASAEARLRTSINRPRRSPPVEAETSLKARIEPGA